MMEVAGMKISIDKALCKGCGICVSICPEKVYRFSNRRSSYSSTMPDPFGSDACTGCRMCERLCPDAAINVVKKES